MVGDDSNSFLSVTPSPLFSNGIMRDLDFPICLHV